RGAFPPNRAGALRRRTGAVPDDLPRAPTVAFDPRTVRAHDVRAPNLAHSRSAAAPAAGPPWIRDASSTTDPAQARTDREYRARGPSEFGPRWAWAPRPRAVLRDRHRTRPPRHRLCGGLERDGAPLCSKASERARSRRQLAVPPRARTGRRTPSVARPPADPRGAPELDRWTFAPRRGAA